MTGNLDEVLIRMLGYEVEYVKNTKRWYCAPIDGNRYMTLVFASMTAADTKEKAIEKLLKVLEQNERN